jgi:hypothetical protein
MDRLRRLNDFALLRGVNIEICRGAGSSPEPLPLFCECGAAGCFTPVWLTPREFARFVAQADRVLAPDHDPAAPPRPSKRTRSTARRHRRARAVVSN